MTRHHQRPVLPPVKASQAARSRSLPSELLARAAFRVRVLAWVAACAGLGRDDNVLIVTSGGVIGRYTSEVLDAGADAAIQLNLQIRNTGVTEVIRPTSGSARLVSFNAIPHLERPGRADAITHS